MSKDYKKGKKRKQGHDPTKGNLKILICVFAGVFKCLISSKKQQQLVFVQTKQSHIKRVEYAAFELLIGPFTQAVSYCFQ